MQFPQTRILRSIAWTAALVGAAWLAGQAQAADAEGPRIDPQAKKVLMALADYYQKVKSLSAELDSKIEFQVGEEKGKMEHEYDLAMQRPNRFAAIVTQGEQATTIVCDGKQLYTSLPLVKKYTVQEAPASMEGVLGTGPIKYLNSQHGLQVMAALLAPKTYDAFLDHVTEVAFVGQEEIAGKKCNRLKFSHEGLDFDLWTEAGEKPLVLKMSPDMGKLIKKQAGGNPPAGFKVDVQIFVKKMVIDPALTDATFKFTPPSGSEKADALLPGQKGDEPHPLLNKPAPPISLAQLSGGTFKLADQKGKIVILDFWATWCGPCVKAMPILAEVAAKYKSKGVVLYAVNLEEKSEEVAAFLKENKLDVSVVFDSDGAASKTYQVEGIPQSVIIDKSGVVRVVHVGIAPNFKEQLTEELDAILAGKNPSEEKK